MKFIIVSGLLYSGAGAVKDFLKEFDNAIVYKEEFRLISDPGGIRTLEDNLVNHWTPLRATAAISDFLVYAEKCGRRKSYFPFASFGMGYKYNIHPEFMYITSQYINELTYSTYFEDFYFNKARKSYFTYVIDRWRYGVQCYSKNWLRIGRNYKCYFAKPTKERFESCTRKYLDTLFENNQGKEITVLFQGVHPCDTEVICRYFDNAKMIIIERDPRDIYISSVEHHGVVESDIDGFIRKQVALREGRIDSPNVLRIQFEELVLNYDDWVAKIMDFCDMRAGNHIFPKRYFIPEESVKNVGIWKQFYRKHKAAIEKIEKSIECWRMTS